MDKVILENEVREIALGDLVLDIGQVRTERLGTDIHELAESIKKVGLLHPIIVCPSEETGKYEIIAGQRRFLAHREILHAETIKARIIKEKLNEFDAKVLSLTENWNRLDLSTKDERDVCLILYRRYKSIDLIVGDTGLPVSKVQKYLRWDSLAKPLQELVDRNEIDLDAAYRAKKALEVSGEADDEKVIEVAKELQGMSNPQRKKVGKSRKENPEKPMEEIIEEAKSGEKLMQMYVTLGHNAHKALQKYARSEAASQDAAAAGLIEDGLVNKGFLESE